MSNDINLLQTNRSHHSPVLEKRVRIFRTISVTFLFVVAILSTSLFIISNLSSLPKLKEEEQRLIADFSENPLRSKSDAYFLTKVRSEDVTKLLVRRTKLLQSYSTLLAFSSSLSVTSLQVNRASSVLVVASDNLLDIQNLLVAFKALPETDKSIESVTVSSIDFDSETGNFEVSIEILNKQA